MLIREDALLVNTDSPYKTVFNTFYMKPAFYLKTALAIIPSLAFCLSAQPQTAKNIVYQDDNVRITLIDDGAARLEYSPEGKFVDDRSQIAVIRQYAPVASKVYNSAKKVSIRTDAMTITYLKSKGPFTASNLSITPTKKFVQQSFIRTAGAKPFTWKPGMKDNANLKGTYYSLDMYNGNMKDGKSMPMEDGLLSRNGWTLIDDSRSYLFDNSPWPWLKERPDTTKAQDWYFLCYGHNYKKALRMFTKFAGKVPLPPRYAFGYWWSRYWSYSDDELRNLVDNFREYDIPLDVLVLDMDWHYNQAPRGGWTGYTWNRTLFPDPKGFLRWVKSNNFEITMNLHPDTGIKTWEEQWPAMSKWMGVDTALYKDIPFETSNKLFMSGWFNEVLRPMEKDGVDFWWIDGEPKGVTKKLTNLNDTWWINYAVFSDMERNRTTRPMLYNRWGGLGNHRYQIGFSGDAVISWNSLDFQPYFNSTASNELACYWSHDIGGHVGTIEPEIYVRWMQFGLFSPILRSHSAKIASINKEPWVFSYPVTHMLRNIIKHRYALNPYIYTMARKTYDEALPLCRPMYYDYPDSPEAYAKEQKNEYMFGDNILVRPITAPMQGAKAMQAVWLPQGNDWYEVASGTLLKGGQTVQHGFHLDEIPVYVKAGSIIPMYGDTLKNLRSNDNPVILNVYPYSGDCTSKAEYYEDAGNDKQYATQYAVTPLSASRQGKKLTVKIGARHGNYLSMPTRRKYQVMVIASVVPEEVLVNKRKTAFHYDGMTLSLIVDLGSTNCANENTVEITYPSTDQCISNGEIGQMRRVRENVYQPKVRNANIVLTDDLANMESAGRAITYNPSLFTQKMNFFHDRFAHLEEVLQAQKLSDADYKFFNDNTY